MYKNCVPVCIENCVLHQCLVYRRRTLPPGPRVVPVWRLSVHFAIKVNHVFNIQS